MHACTLVAMRIASSDEFDYASCKAINYLSASAVLVSTIAVPPGELAVYCGNLARSVQ